MKSATSPVIQQLKKMKLYSDSSFGAHSYTKTERQVYNNENKVKEVCDKIDQF